MRDELQVRAQAWTERTCAEQGVPVYVNDRQVLAQVVALLRVGGIQPSPADVVVAMRAA